MSQNLAVQRMESIESEESNYTDCESDLDECDDDDDDMDDYYNEDVRCLAHAIQYNNEML